MRNPDGAFEVRIVQMLCFKHNAITIAFIGIIDAAPHQTYGLCASADRGRPLCLEPGINILRSWSLIADMGYATTPSRSKAQLIASMTRAVSVFVAPRAISRAAQRAVAPVRLSAIDVFGVADHQGYLHLIGLERLLALQTTVPVR